MLALAGAAKAGPNAERERAAEADLSLSELVAKRLMDNTSVEQSAIALATALLSGLGITQGAVRDPHCSEAARQVRT